LGFALQLTTVRWLGTFLSDPTDVPDAVLGYLARQLDVAEPAVVGRYLDRRSTRFEHAEEIKASEGLEEFAVVAGEFEEWVADRAFITGDGPRTIFADSVGWLRERDVLLPGVTTLVRLIAAARADGDTRLWEVLAAVVSELERASLDGLLEVPQGARMSGLERLRRGPADPTGKSRPRATGRWSATRTCSACSASFTGISSAATSTRPNRRGGGTRERSCYRVRHG
jgi:hypothetical protein